MFYIMRYVLSFISCIFTLFIKNLKTKIMKKLEIKIRVITIIMVPIILIGAYIAFVVNQ